MQPRTILPIACLAVALTAAPAFLASPLDPSSGVDAEAAAQDRTIQVSGEDFSFTPSTIEVDEGETITFEFTNDGTVVHNFGGEFGRTDTIAAGETDTVTATFDSPGDQAFWCSVGNHRDMGMEGTITVQEAAGSDGGDGEDGDTTETGGDGDTTDTSDDGETTDGGDGDDESTPGVALGVLVAGLLAAVGLHRRD